MCKMYDKQTEQKMNYNKVKTFFCSTTESKLNVNAVT